MSKVTSCIQGSVRFLQIEALPDGYNILSSRYKGVASQAGDLHQDRVVGVGGGGELPHQAGVDVAVLSVGTLTWDVDIVTGTESDSR